MSSLHIVEMPIIEQVGTHWEAHYPERDWVVRADTREEALAGLLAEEQRREQEDPGYADRVLARLLDSQHPNVRVEGT